MLPYKASLQGAEAVITDSNKPQKLAQLSAPKWGVKGGTALFPESFVHVSSFFFFF